MSLLLLSLNDQRAPIDLLERVVVSDAERGRLIGGLAASGNVDEVVVVSTCQRTEIYASIQRFHGAVEEITSALTSVLNVSPDEISPYLTIEHDRGVTRHLFEVASGMASVVPGEYEILGQLRRSLDQSTQEGVVGERLRDLFGRAFTAGRRVRNETQIARGVVSFAQSAVDILKRDQALDLTNQRVTVLGAGQLATNLVKSLASQLPQIGEIYVLNRSHASAEELRAEVGDPRVRIGTLDELSDVVNKTRVLITALETSEHLVTEEHVGHREEPLLCIDLGMPRIIQPDVDQLAPITLLDMSDLRAEVESTIAERYRAFEAARNILDGEIHEYYERRRTRGAAESVTQLRGHLEAQRSAELERHAAALAALDDRSQALVDEITRGVIAKIAHRPTVVLKETAGSERGERLADALRQLFSFPDPGAE